MRVVQTSYFRLAASAVMFLANSMAQTTARPQFEAASIKPDHETPNYILIHPPAGGRYTADHISLQFLITAAYKIKQFQITGGPSWINTERYDVEAKAADSHITDEQFRLMLQSLLADRFKLALHRETKQVPVYALLPAKGGLKLPAVKEGGCVAFDPKSPPPPPAPGQMPPIVCGGFLRAPNFIQAGKAGMAQLANALSDIVERPVIDKTGFTGTFDVRLDFSPEGTTFATDGATPDTSRPSIFTALQEQLGLKLESRKGPSEILVIDHAEKASEN